MCQRIQDHTPQHSLSGVGEMASSSPGLDGDSGYGCNELTTEVRGRGRGREGREEEGEGERERERGGEGKGGRG